MESTQPLTQHKPKGGARPGAGRPPGAMSKMAKAAREAAAATGLLPHEFLLAVARGEKIKQLVPIGSQVIDGVEETMYAERYVVPGFQERVDAAKAAAPYFAPKISTVEVITGVTDEQLDEIIAGAASQAGIGVSFGGEGEEDDDPEGTGVSPPPSRERRRVGGPAGTAT